MVVHILPWWECWQVYQIEGLFHERCLDFWLFWYQIYDCTWKEQILHSFEDQTFVYFYNVEQVNFRLTLVLYPHFNPGDVRYTCQRPFMNEAYWWNIVHKSKQFIGGKRWTGSTIGHRYIYIVFYIASFFGCTQQTILELLWVDMQVAM